jgi:hypothetical protein
MARVLVTLGVAIAVAAVALPVTSVGIGWLISALAALAVAVAARTLRGTLVEPPTGPAPQAWSTLPPITAPPITAPPVPAVTPLAPPPPATPPAPPPAAPPVPPGQPTPAATVTPVLPVFPPPPGAAAALAPAAAVPAAVAPPRPLIEIPAPIDLPVGPPGAIAGVVAPASRPVPTPPEVTPPTRGDRIWRYAAGFVALVFVAAPAVRASGVVAVLCILAALLLASYALVGGRTWASVLFNGLVLIPGVMLGAHWIITHRPRPGRLPTGARVGRILVAVVVTLTLIAVLIPLLRSADPVFADLLDSWTKHLPRLDGRSVTGALALAVIGVGTAYFAYRGPVPNRSTVEGARPLRGLEWLLPIVVVNVIFAVFVVVQINVLFGGHQYVLGAGGPDYADYARGGFGQLCVVTMISLGLAAGLGGLVRQDTLRRRVMILVMGGLLCALTLLIVVSALRRMLLYVDVYGFTWLRILSFSGEVFLGLVFALLLVAGIRLRGAWLPRATATTAVAVLLALVAVNPEAVMARTSIEARQDGPYAVDLDFLDWLSADAVDEILRLPTGERDCALERLREDLREPDAWYEFNLARYHAREVLASVAERSCPTDLDRLS